MWWLCVRVWGVRGNGGRVIVIKLQKKKKKKRKKKNERVDISCKATIPVHEISIPQFIGNFSKVSITLSSAE